MPIKFLRHEDSSENCFHGLLYITLLCCHLLNCQWSQTNDTYNCDTHNLVLPSAYSKQGQDASGMTIHGWSFPVVYEIVRGIWCVVETYMLQVESLIVPLFTDGGKLSVNPALGMVIQVTKLKLTNGSSNILW